MSRILYVKRTHGLGNVFLLLPVLEHLLERGRPVRLLTGPDWAEAVAALAPGLDVDVWNGTEPTGAEFADLDAMTLNVRPVEHRTMELARLLDVEDRVAPRRYQVPELWAAPFAHLRGAVLFAVEAGHPARQWPWEHVRELTGRLAEEERPLVITGVADEPDLPCDHDLRGNLDLRDMLGLVSVASAMISLDSGALHMATSLGLPCVAVFGGLDPRLRIRSGQCAVALQADLDCVPCNKNETCDGRMDCLRAIRPGHVLDALRSLDRAAGRDIRRITP